MGCDARGQAHTLEAVAAAIVLLSAILFALQVTAVTPLSGSTSNQHIETQQAELAQGVLAGEAENGSLKRMLVYYNTSADDGHRFHNATGGSGQYDGTIPTGENVPAVAPALSETFLDRGTAVNVDLYYLEPDGRRRQPLIDLGTPSDHATTATQQVTLFENDTILASDGTPTDETVAEAAANDSYYVGDGDDIDGDASSVFNVVEVEVTVWRM
ncbi:hypothetical protein SAMN05192561_10675 [Halopenitus malekzadehii]|uniref:Uncharacterized protein n=1 Tax=Halopenitus malekzadehii TaxID=1267564 RepID=A0A1H6J532_9EURY|nr:hypothetical protein [Halopenitus malekzadehii]SEH55357.1 hypothetical protein SAMN05192561_10675 [Halopenitus malekzadehii]